MANKNKKNSKKYDGYKKNTNNESINDSLPGEGFDQGSNKERTKGHNDMKWYINNHEEIKADIASIYQRSPLGIAAPRNIVTDTQLVYNAGTALTLQAIPVLIKFKVFSGIGKAANASDAVNVAGRKLYGKMRKLNSNNMPYAIADVMMVVGAYASVYQIFTHAMRLYRLCYGFKSDNLSTPDYVIAALTGNQNFAQDFRDHATDYLSALNGLAITINEMVTIPSDVFYLIEKTSYTFEKVFTDDPDEWQKGQLYACVPEGYYTWSDTDDPNGSMLKFSFMPESYSMGDLITILRNMINAVVYSSSVRQIVADIQKVWDGPTYNIDSHMTADQHIEPIYDYEMLMQLKNAYVLGDSIYCCNSDTNAIANLAASRHIKQDASHAVIVADPAFTNSVCSKYVTSQEPAPAVKFAAQTDRVIDLGPKGASLDQVLLYTHFQYAVKPSALLSTQKNICVTLEQFSGEVICGMEIFMPNAVNTPYSPTLTGRKLSTIMGLNGSDVVYNTATAYLSHIHYMDRVAMLRQFKFAPSVLWLEYWYGSSTSNGFRYLGEVFDTDVFYYLPPLRVTEIHNNVIRNMFGVLTDSSDIR